MQSDLNFAKLDLNTPNHVQEQMKSNPKQSLQLLISHQMILYSSVKKSLCGFSYTCFSGTQVLWQFGETGPEYPKSCTKTHEKESKDFSSSFNIK